MKKTVRQNTMDGTMVKSIPDKSIPDAQESR